jgi:protein O-GlcNAc transferase
MQTATNNELNEIIQLAQGGQLSEAKQRVETFLINEPADLAALRLAILLNIQLKHSQQALNNSKKALQFDSNNPEFYHFAGVACCQLSHFAESINYFKKAIGIKPDYSETLYNLGLAYVHLADYENAIIYFNKSLALTPQMQPIYHALLDALLKTNKVQQGIELLQKALANNINSAAIHNNLASLLQQTGQYADAIKHYQQAIQLEPKFKLAYSNLAGLLTNADHHQEAIACYQQALQHFPEDVELLSGLFNAKKQSCDWNDLDNIYQQLINLIKLNLANNKPCGLAPFTALSTWLPYPTLYQLVRNYAYYHSAKSSQPLRFNFNEKNKNNQQKIRIAYLSPNFCNHPTARNILHILRHHNRDKFEVIVYSLGKDDQSNARKNIEKAADRFIDVQNASDHEISDVIRGDNIDVLVSLMGYTNNSRLAILAEHPAPIQIGYQSYPGTLGNHLLDYFIADEIVLPSEHQQYYDEKILYLPHCYYAVDPYIPDDISVSRAECQLPDDAFVFCCFSSHYKIEPMIFEMWMQILKQVPKSVLWLFGKLNHIKNNLRREAAKYQISSDRLIFAPGKNNQYHLARHQHADLFLDTIVCNAHTTAADALKMNVPVLTMLGDTLVRRVSASLLQAIDLPELVTSSKDDYIRQAVDYANDRQKLKALKSKLMAHKKTYPLFNNGLFVKNYEDVIIEAYRGWCSIN